jgi:hypothetical protein
MNNIFRNTVLTLLALAAISMLARNFSGAATTTSTAPARHYYLTKAASNGNQPLTACAAGYHFASFAEIVDPAVLTYNKTLGRHAADDGEGPPILDPAAGWIRTGYFSTGTATSANSPTNCSVWTDGTSQQVGEIAAFAPISGQGTTNPPLFYGNSKCDNSGGGKIGVWCVEN